MLEVNKIYNADCLELLPIIDDSSIDLILTDPPFLYLKNQKLERSFNEVEFFTQAYRILKDNGFIAVFGRGESFYRWNVIMANLGFKFKEEIIWDKGRTTSPVLPLSRKHETVSVYTKKNGKIRRCYVPYLEKKTSIETIEADINRLKAILNNPDELEEIRRYITTGEKKFSENKKVTKFKTSVQDTGSSSRAENVFAAFRRGGQESDIIRVVKNVYKAIHPTEKPVRLLERILSVLSDEGALVLDPFCGSGSTCEAARNTGRNYIGVEIDEEYYTGAKKRLDLKLF